MRKRWLSFLGSVLCIGLLSFSGENVCFAGLLFKGDKVEFKMVGENEGQKLSWKSQEYEREGGTCYIKFQRDRHTELVGENRKEFFEGLDKVIKDEKNTARYRLECLALKLKLGTFDEIKTIMKEENVASLVQEHGFMCPSLLYRALYRKRDIHSKEGCGTEEARFVDTIIEEWRQFLLAGIDACEKKQNVFEVLMKNFDASQILSVARCMNLISDKTLNLQGWDEIRGALNGLDIVKFIEKYNSEVGAEKEGLRDRENLCQTTV